MTASRLLLAAAALALAACVSPAPSAPSSLRPSIAAGPLVTVMIHGGLCPDGPCERTTYLDRDGLVRAAEKSPSELGRMDAGALATLRAAIEATDFAELRSHPFRGECPMNYDGQELVLTFATSHGAETLASCTTEIGFDTPLMVALKAALTPVTRSSSLGR